MRFTNTTEYALRVLIAMAREPRERLSVRHLHEALALPEKYLGRLMGDLARHGLLVATRGKLGGYALARPAREIPILRVVEVFEGLESYARCMLGLETCDPARPCAVHDRLVGVRDALRAALSNTSIEDVAVGRVALLAR